MRGRTAKPKALAALQGNTRRQKKAAEVPQEISEKVFFSDVWAAPGWLTDGAKEIWAELLPVVRRETKIQESQLPVFAMYCDAVHRFRIFTKALEAGATYTTPSGYQRKRPEVEMRDAAANAVRNLAAELNLTPKSWISSMGTFAGRQLDLFMNGGAKPADGLAQPGGKPPEENDLDRFLGARPTLQ